MVIWFVVFSIVMGAIGISLFIIIYKLLFVWNPCRCIHPNHYNLKRALKSLRKKHIYFDRLCNFIGNLRIIRLIRRLPRRILRRSSNGDIEEGQNVTCDSSGQPERIQTEKIFSGSLSLTQQTTDSSYENVTISDGIIITGEEYTGEEKGEKSCQKPRQDGSTLDEENWSETQEENNAENKSLYKNQVSKDGHSHFYVQENDNDNPNENGNSTNSCSERDSETLLIPPPVPELSDSIAKPKQVQISKTL